MGRGGPRLVGNPTIVDLHRATVYHDKDFHEAMDTMCRLKVIDDKEEWRDWPFLRIRQFAKMYNHARSYGGGLHEFYDQIVDQKR
jgi:hypothetical protein